MTSVKFVNLRVNNAEQFREALAEPIPNTSIFMTFGKVDAWANDAAPDTANSSISTVYEIWKNMVGGKKVLGGDLHHVIPRNNWTANSVYTPYDNLSSNLYDDDVAFCVVNSDLSVYKCISNNGGANSTIEPTSVNPSITSTTSDGYSWKFMYNISDAEEIRFTTESYIPVKTISSDDGSLQWQVQENAEDGAINSVIIINAGTGYTNSSNIVVTVSGDGSSFSGFATVNTTTNTISSISITNPGAGYTYATVDITDLSGNGSSAEARAIISPPGGHGSNPLYELGGKNVMINTKFIYDEDEVFPLNNDFRQIALLKDPYLNGTANVATNTTFLQATTLIVAGIGSYVDDEYVYQGSSFATATFSGRVVEWNETTGKLILINTEGTPTASFALIGSTSSTSRVISSITENAFQPYTGQILYVDNIKPVTRSSDQIEDFRILVNF